MTRRRHNPDSVHSRRQERLRAEQELTHEGKPWTDGMIDVLLNGVFHYEFAYESRRVSLVSTCRRTPHAIRGMLQKLFTNYDRQCVRGYTPGPKRIGRAGPLSCRDLEMVLHATGKYGVGNGAHEPEYVAKVTGRTAKDVDKKLAELAALKEVFYPKGELSLTPAERAGVIHHILTTMPVYKRLIRQSGL